MRLRLSKSQERKLLFQGSWKAVLLPTPITPSTPKHCSCVATLEGDGKGLQEALHLDRTGLARMRGKRVCQGPPSLHGRGSPAAAAASFSHQWYELEPLHRAHGLGVQVPSLPGLIVHSGTATGVHSRCKAPLPHEVKGCWSVGCPAGHPHIGRPTARPGAVAASRAFPPPGIARPTGPFQLAQHLRKGKCVRGPRSCRQPHHTVGRPHPPCQPASGDEGEP